VDGLGCPVELHDRRLGVAYADFKAVVKMQTAGFNIGNMPAIPCKQKDWKIRRQIVASAFQNASFSLWHNKNPFLRGAFDNFILAYIQDVVNIQMFHIMHLLCN